METLVLGNSDIIIGFVYFDCETILLIRRKCMKIIIIYNKKIHYERKSACNVKCPIILIYQIVYARYSTISNLYNTKQNNSLGVMSCPCSTILVFTVLSF